jgi:hypothetical protein
VATAEAEAEADMKEEAAVTMVVSMMVVAVD